MTTTLTPISALNGASLAPAIVAPRAGKIDDIGSEDDARGYERDETDQHHQLVDRLVADGDTRARAAGRRARRTLAEMQPDYVRQPVLRMVGPLTFRSADGPCPLCDRWNCTPNTCPPGVAPPVLAASTAGVTR
ncbi:hypothetical protein [Streptomyces drozdowiczii]|uniref:Uncharacterized protein n=1 Tax=Streptomyces drozdowiczii TaxID=202862 RepID=A0ABY6Q1U2_9ACTN|nr:hypothetical protein [Streptomyces drozdowiczii]MCX0247929.1 hypothetical protein [Streptomyces drozdowiczii]MCX0247957.1 hypothetical protein [Streptomyces drozdowiczii]UZK58217.1 hypothetical protein NEH16_32785 [Streptomyces drozdowiczii]